MRKPRIFGTQATLPEIEKATCPLCRQRVPVMYHIPYSNYVGIGVHFQPVGGFCPQRESPRSTTPEEPR